VLQQAEHAFLRREGPNLLMKKSITLLEALTGFHFYVKHLDGRVLNVKSDANVIYKQGDMKTVKEEGMPYPNNPYQKGNLFIEFNVEFPKELDSKSRNALLHCLPSPLSQPVPSCKRKETRVDDDGMEVEYEVDDVPEDHVLTDFDVNAEREAQRQYNTTNQNQYDEDEDAGRGQGQSAGCRAQ